LSSYVSALSDLYRMMRSCYWPRAKLLQYQTRELRRIVRYSYDNIPYYHDSMRALDIRPDDIRTLKDLNRMPILRKNTIRADIDGFISKEFSQDRLRVRSTSGSTGHPLRIYLTPREDAFRKAKHLRANMSCGHRIRDRWVVITSPSHLNESTGLQKRLGLYSPLFVSVFDSTEQQLSRIQELQPEVLDGYSSSLYLLAKEAEKRGIEAMYPRMIFGGAELASDDSKRYVEKVFRAPFYDQYATVELERIAWECKAKQGYHIDADAMILQLVDDNGDELSEGESGEMICTSLFNYAMPLIRYAVGDIGVLSDEECDCGRTLPLLKTVEGRSDSLLVLPDGRRLSPRVFTNAVGLFELIGCLEQYSVVQKKVDHFELVIKEKENAVDRTILAAKLLKHLERTIQIDMNEVQFDVRFADSIPMDKGGKMKIVTSEISSLTT
jgi:phenylacetate-CoA ligase